MPFESFCKRCNDLIAKSGEACDVRFRNEDGKYTAKFSNGVRITGNSVCLSVRVEWGSGHGSNVRI